MHRTKVISLATLLPLAARGPREVDSGALLLVPVTSKATAGDEAPPELREALGCSSILDRRVVSIVRMNENLPVPFEQEEGRVAVRLDLVRPDDVDTILKIELEIP